MDSRAHLYGVASSPTRRALSDTILSSWSISRTARASFSSAAPINCADCIVRGNKAWVGMGSVRGGVSILCIALDSPLWRDDGGEEKEVEENALVFHWSCFEKVIDPFPFKGIKWGEECLWVLGNDSTLFGIDPATAQVKWERGIPDEVCSLLANVPSMPHHLFACVGKEIHCWDERTLEVVKVWKCRNQAIDLVCCFAFPMSPCIGCIDGSGKCVIWDLRGTNNAPLRVCHLKFAKDVDESASHASPEHANRQSQIRFRSVSVHISENEKYLIGIKTSPSHDQGGGLGGEVMANEIRWDLSEQAASVLPTRQSNVQRCSFFYDTPMQRWMIAGVDGTIYPASRLGEEIEAVVPGREEDSDRRIETLLTVGTAWAPTRYLQLRRYGRSHSNSNSNSNSNFLDLLIHDTFASGLLAAQQLRKEIAVRHCYADNMAANNVGDATMIRGEDNENADEEEDDEEMEEDGAEGQSVLRSCDGHVAQRMNVVVCLTCSPLPLSPTSSRLLCKHCAHICHATHQVVELGLRSHTVCECVNGGSSSCRLLPPGTSAAALEEARAATQGNRKESPALIGSFCLCQQGDDGALMIQCCSCDNWFHSRCIGLGDAASVGISDDDMERTQYLCPHCLHLPETQTIIRQLQAEETEPSWQYSLPEGLLFIPSRSAEEALQQMQPSGATRREQSPNPQEGRLASFLRQVMGELVQDGRVDVSAASILQVMRRLQESEQHQP